MSAYFITTYNVSDPDGYAQYNPGSLGVIMQTMTKHGGTLIAAGHDCVRVNGPEKDVKIVIKFPDAAAAQAWLDDPDYAAAKAIRLAATTDIDGFIIDEFVPPSG